MAMTEHIANGETLDEIVARKRREREAVDAAARATTLPPQPPRRSLDEIAADVRPPRRSLDDIAASVAFPAPPAKPSLANLKRPTAAATSPGSSGAFDDLIPRAEGAYDDLIPGNAPRQPDALDALIASRRAAVTGQSMTPSAPPAKASLKDLAKGVFKLTGAMVSGNPSTIAETAADPTARGLAISAVQGATGSWADEGAGVVGGLAALAKSGANYRDGYTTARDAVRREDESFAKANPGAALAANLAGGIAPAVLTMGSAGAVSGATTAQKVRAAMKGGAAFGALQGGGSADNGMLETAGGAVLGAGIGAAAGGLGQKIGSTIADSRIAQQGMGAVKRGLAALARKPLPDEAPGVPALTDKALRALSGTFKDPSADIARIAADGSPEMLAMRVPERTQRVFRAADALSPDGTTVNALNERIKQQGPNLAKTIGGDEIVVPEFVEGFKQQATANASPLFEAARQSPDVAHPVFPDLLETPYGKEAWNMARRDALNEPVKANRAALPSAEDVLKRYSGTTGDDAVAVNGRTSKMAGKTPEELYNMDAVELRSYRPSPKTPIAKLTDTELEMEYQRLRELQEQDWSKAQIRRSLDYQEYLSLKDIGLHEDARGIIQKMGYDPETFAHDVARDAALAEKQATQRAPKLAKMEEELAAREALRARMPEDAATTPSTSMPSRDAVSLPDESAAPSLTAVPVEWLHRMKVAYGTMIDKAQANGDNNAVRQLQTHLSMLRDALEGHAPVYGKALSEFEKPMAHVDAARMAKDGDAANMIRGVNGSTGPEIQYSLSKLAKGRVPEAAGAFRTVGKQIQRDYLRSVRPDRDLSKSVFADGLKDQQIQALMTPEERLAWAMQLQREEQAGRSLDVIGRGSGTAKWQQDIGALKSQDGYLADVARTGSVKAPIKARVAQWLDRRKLGNDRALGAEVDRMGALQGDDLATMLRQWADAQKGVYNPEGKRALVFGTQAANGINSLWSRP